MKKKKLNVYKQQTVINHNTVKPESMSMYTFLWTNYNKYLILVKKKNINIYIYIYIYIFFLIEFLKMFILLFV